MIEGMTARVKDVLSDDVAIIIPVYNEGTVIKNVVQNVSKFFAHIVCVDDGSKDNSAAQISKTAAVLVQHPINMGQGAALQTGIEYALQNPKIKYFVTFDADGQHDIGDVARMLKVLETESLDIVLGSRFLGEAPNMPKAKRVILKMAIAFTNIFSGVKLTDTHNGLRAFNRSFAEAVNITMPDMAHASEIIDRIGGGDWKYKEVPITIHYTDYSKAKGQSIFNSVNILFDLFLAKAGRK